MPSLRPDDRADRLSFESTAKPIPTGRLRQSLFLRHREPVRNGAGFWIRGCLQLLKPRFPTLSGLLPKEAVDLIDRVSCKLSAFLNLPFEEQIQQFRDPIRQRPSPPKTAPVEWRFPDSACPLTDPPLVRSSNPTADCARARANQRSPIEFPALLQICHCGRKTARARAAELNRAAGEQHYDSQSSRTGASS
jgi:hypothetical protein